MTVNWMLENMPSTEIEDWRVFFKMESENETDRKSRRDMLRRLMGKKGR